VDGECNTGGTGRDLLEVLADRLLRQLAGRNVKSHSQAYGHSGSGIT